LFFGFKNIDKQVAWNSIHETIWITNFIFMFALYNFLIILSTCWDYIICSSSLLKKKMLYGMQFAKEINVILKCCVQMLIL